MPTYKYACLDCKRTINMIHSIKHTQTRCPECGGLLERIICYDGHTEYHGEGFHCNDYRKDVTTPKDK